MVESMKTAAPQDRMTITIELADGTPLAVTLHADSIGFIGHHARLPAFGPRDAMMRFRLMPAR